jgi:hypothetical protein
MKKVFRIIEVNEDDGALIDDEWGLGGGFLTEREAEEAIEEAFFREEEHAIEHGTPFRFDRGLMIVPCWVRDQEYEFIKNQQDA